MTTERTSYTPDHRFFDRGVHVRGATRVQRSGAALYDACRDIAKLARFVEPVGRVEVRSSTESRWHVRGSGRDERSWEITIINDEPGKLIAWKSAEDAPVPNAGSIRFHELEHGKGTEVKVTVEYLPANSTVGAVLGRDTGDEVRSIVQGALHRFRQFMETGEIPVAELPKESGPAKAEQERRDRPGEAERSRTETNVRDVARGKGARR